MTDKYDGKGLEVITVNIVAKQDADVVPFLSQNHYTFRTYKANLDIVQSYSVSGAPTEYIIDRQGKVVAQVRLNSDERERQVGELVEKLMR